MAILNRNVMSDKQITELLRQARTIAVVGLSSNRMRASFGVSRFLQRQGYRIIPVNPNESEVLGERAYARLVDVPDDRYIQSYGRHRRHQSCSDAVCVNQLRPNSYDPGAYLPYEPDE